MILRRGEACLVMLVSVMLCSCAVHSSGSLNAAAYYTDDRLPLEASDEIDDAIRDTAREIDGVASRVEAQEITRAEGEARAALLREQLANLQRRRDEMAAFEASLRSQNAASPVVLAGTVAASLGRMPSLPSPLPAPSDKTACPRPEDPSLKSYQALIDAALDAAGQTSGAYYRYLDGFAVVSKMERISEDGAPAAEDRWPDSALSRRRSLIEIIAGFIAPRPGFYRFAVITVGSLEPRIDVRQRQTPEGAAVLHVSGAAEKPDVSEAPIDFSLKCTILIYEFEQEPSGEKTRQRFPSSIPALAHARYLGFEV